MLDLALILPSYNEAKNLSHLIPDCVAEARAFGFKPDRFQIVIVDNGSTDNTQAVLKELTESELGDWIHVLRIAENIGYGDGVYTGLQALKARYLAWTHADGQCHPRDVFMAYSQASLYKALCKGRRVGRSWVDWGFSRCFEWVVWILLRVRLYEINAQPKVFPSWLLTELKDFPLDYAFDLFVLLAAHESGLEILSVPVQFYPRVHGVSHWARGVVSRVRTIGKIIGFILKSRKEAFLRHAN